MTVRQAIEKRLVEHGLWPNEATTIVKELEPKEVVEAFQGRWDEDESVYGPMMVNIIFLSAKRQALEYIDKDCPSHFARVLLTDK